MIHCDQKCEETEFEVMNIHYALTKIIIHKLVKGTARGRQAFWGFWVIFLKDNIRSFTLMISRGYLLRVVKAYSK